MSDFFRADLHCHSTCSDGTVSPKDLVQLAVDKGLQGLSITDHDTVNAYSEAMLAAQSIDLFLISGIEFSAVHRNSNVHILAYSFPLNSPELLEFCKQHYLRRMNRLHMFLERLTSNGMPLKPEDVLFNNSIGRPHIAMAMVKKGYVPTIQQAFQLYLGEGKPCYVPGVAYSVEETLDIIHRSKGLAIIAHPHLIKDGGIVNELLNLNFDGIEGYYGRFPATAHERWLKIGARKGWIITGGSDFHGEVKPDLPLGSSWVCEETFMSLYHHFQNNEKICPTPL